MSHEHANTKCNLLRILFMFIISKYAVKETSLKHWKETRSGWGKRGGACGEWNMNMMQQRKGTPLLSIGTGSRSDRDRRGCRRVCVGGVGRRGRWRLLVPANDCARIRVARGVGAVSQRAIAQCTGWNWLTSYSGYPISDPGWNPSQKNQYFPRTSNLNKPLFGFDWPYLVLWSLKAELQSSGMLIFADL